MKSFKCPSCGTLIDIDAGRVIDCSAVMEFNDGSKSEQVRTYKCGDCGHNVSVFVVGSKRVEWEFGKFLNDGLAKLYRGDC